MGIGDLIINKGKRVRDDGIIVDADLAHVRIGNGSYIHDVDVTDMDVESLKRYKFNGDVYIEDRNGDKKD